jgi:hypothetical protein
MYVGDLDAGAANVGAAKSRIITNAVHTENARNLISDSSSVS